MMKEKRKSLNPDNNQQDTLEQLTDACGHNVLAAITQLYGEDALLDSQPQAIHVAVSAANAIIQIIASIVGCPRGPIATDNWNDASVQYAGQLIAAATRYNATGETPQLSVAAGPDVLATALRNTELVMGRNIDSELNPSLVLAARDERAISSAAARRAAQFGGNHSRHLH